MPQFDTTLLWFVEAQSSPFSENEDLHNYVSEFVGDLSELPTTILIEPYRLIKQQQRQSKITLELLQQECSGSKVLQKDLVFFESVDAEMKKTRQRPLPMLLVFLVLTIHAALSFTSTLNRRRSKNPLVRLPEKNNDDDDSKIDWDPKSRPKLAKKPSYSDNWLLNFHLWDQNEKQLVTNSLTKWNEVIRDQQATIIEWQDSFQRNELADFTPPMSNGMNCLMVGDDFDFVDDVNGNRRVKLPWEEEPEAQVTSLRVLGESLDDTKGDDSILSMDDTTDTNKETHDDDDEVIITINSSDDDVDANRNQSVPGAIVPQGFTPGTNGQMIRTQLVTPSSTAAPESSKGIRSLDSNRQAAIYDCIVDQGLMDRIMALDNSEQTVRDLLEEAAVAIKDLGIYVLVTRELSMESRKMLEEYGLEAGLEWQFELDGISDETQVVSVARRFCTGEMPKVGKLSRFYQP